MSQILAKLRQKKFIQWIIAYLAGAWILLQVLGFLFQTFHWPDRLLQASTVFLAVGFAAAIIIAWFHGEQGAQRVRVAEVCLLSATLVIALSAGLYVGTHSTAPRQDDPGIATNGDEGIRTVAVLPFINTGGDASQEFFSDGMTDELAHALSGIPALRVSSRTSTYAYKGKALTAPEIGKALQVAYIIAGAVRRAGDQVRVTTELTSTSDGVVTWSHEFNSSEHNVFALQDSFTKEIVSALTPRFRGATAASLAEKSRGTTNPDAYQEFLKGRFYWSKRGGANLLKSVEYFKSAIRLDPDFARAHAALGMSYGILPGYVIDSLEVYPSLSRASVARALALDSTLAEVQLASASADMGNLEYPSAERHLRSAVRIDPTSATAHQWLAEALLAQGRIDEALTEAKQSAVIDSLSPIIHYDYSLVLFYSRMMPEAIAQARKSMALDPGVQTWRLGLGTELIFHDNADSAISILEDVLRIEPSLPSLRGALVLAYAAANRWQDAARVRASLHRTGAGDAPNVEARYADMVFGDHEPLITALQTAPGRSAFISSVFLWLPCFPFIDPLRTDPRYTAILDTLHSKDCNRSSPWPVKTQPPANLRVLSR